MQVNHRKVPRTRTEPEPGPSSRQLSIVSRHDLSEKQTEPRTAVGRYYDPATGQFLSVDPLVDETGQPYAYAGTIQ